MTEERELEASIELLQKDNLQSIATVLQHLSGNPLGNIRVLPYIEHYLEDNRLCRFGIPFNYGEIRWLAADALAAERGLLGINESVSLEGVAKPLTEKQLYALLDEVEPGWHSTYRELLDWLETLRTTGRLPTYNKIFPPKKRFASQ